MGRRPTYVSIDDLVLASDFNPSALRSATLTRHLEDACDAIDRSLRRTFYPVTEVRMFRPSSFHRPPGQTQAGFHLDQDDLYSVDSITADGDTVTVADTQLWPTDGPPYHWVGTTGTVIVITGTWGFPWDTDTVTTIAANITDTTSTSVTVADGSQVGVGDLIQINSERLLVTAKATTDSTTDLAADVADSSSTVALSVDDGSVLNVGEVMWVNSERMRIVDIVSDTVTVHRAYQGSTLASHSSGDDVYVERSLTVERGYSGSTAATHTSGDSVSKLVAPGPIRTLTIAEAQTLFEQEGSRYGRTVGAGEAEHEATGAGIQDARTVAASLYRRRRSAAV